MSDRPLTQFEKAAAERSSESFLRELWDFQKQNRKWWLLPMLVFFLLVSAIGLLASTGAAPFIYTIF